MIIKLFYFVLILAAIFSCAKKENKDTSNISVINTEQVIDISNYSLLYTTFTIMENHFINFYQSINNIYIKNSETNQIVSIIEKPIKLNFGTRKNKNYTLSVDQFIPIGKYDKVILHLEQFNDNAISSLNAAELLTVHEINTEDKQRNITIEISLLDEGGLLEIKPKGRNFLNISLNKYLSTSFIDNNKMTFHPVFNVKNTLPSGSYFHRGHLMHESEDVYRFFNDPNTDITTGINHKIAKFPDQIFNEGKLLSTIPDNIEMYYSFVNYEILDDFTLDIKKLILINPETTYFIGYVLAIDSETITITGRESDLKSKVNQKFYFSDKDIFYVDNEKSRKINIGDNILIGFTGNRLIKWGYIFDSTLLERMQKNTTKLNYRGKKKSFFSFFIFSNKIKENYIKEDYDIFLTSLNNKEESIDANSKEVSFFISNRKNLKELFREIKNDNEEVYELQFLSSPFSEVFSSQIYYKDTFVPFYLENEIESIVSNSNKKIECSITDASSLFYLVGQHSELSGCIDFIREEVLQGHFAIDSLHVNGSIESNYIKFDNLKLLVIDKNLIEEKGQLTTYQEQAVNFFNTSFIPILSSMIISGSIIYFKKEITKLFYETIQFLKLSPFRWWQLQNIQEELNQELLKLLPNNSNDIQQLKNKLVKNGVFDITEAISLIDDSQNDTKTQSLELIREYLNSEVEFLEALKESDSYDLDIKKVNELIAHIKSIKNFSDIIFTGGAKAVDNQKAILGEITGDFGLGNKWYSYWWNNKSGFIRNEANKYLNDIVKNRIKKIEQFENGDYILKNKNLSRTDYINFIQNENIYLNIPKIKKSY